MNMRASTMRLSDGQAGHAVAHSALNHSCRVSWASHLTSEAQFSYLYNGKNNSYTNYNHWEFQMNKYMW